MGIMTGEHSGPAFVPAPILHDERLAPREKLLAGRIWNLTKKYGYCDASNAYLAEDLGVHARSLERWISTLRGTEHFRFEYRKNKGGTSRRIYPVTPTDES